MALVVADRVRETSTTTGTGTYTLAGAVLGHQSFSAIGDGNTCYYTATDGTDWEVGTGTYTASGTTLARTTVHASSNSGSAVDWPTTGFRNIYGDLPATVLDSLLSGGGSFSGPGSSTDNAIVRFDGTAGDTGQNSLVTIDDDGTVHVDMSGVGDVDDFWWYGQHDNSSEALKLGFKFPSGNHYYANIESIGNSDLAGVRNRSLRFNCRTSKDTALGGYSAPFVVNVEHYTGAAALVNANAVSVTNADSEIFYIDASGFCESQGGFHYDGGGANSCVYGSGAGVDGNEPNCSSFGVNATCYGDHSVAIGYNAAAGDAGSSVYRYCVAIGSGATADVSNGTAIGYNADTGGTSSGVAIGASSSVTGNNSVAIGASASVTGAFGVAIGQGTANSGSGVTIGRDAVGSNAIGYSADSSGHSSAQAWGTSTVASQLGSIAVGYNSDCQHQGSICLGYEATSTAGGQLVVGSSSVSNAVDITNVYIGNGVTATTPVGVTYHATGGSGTDVDGSNLKVAGGKATGNAAGGEVEFQASTPGSSGTTLQSLATKLRIGYDGTTLVAQTNTPSTPASGECVTYMKGSKYIIAYDDGGTVRYKYLDLSGTGATWTHTTTAP